MAAPRLLPPTQELRKMVSLGLTHSEIADRIREDTGVIVSRSAVSSAISRAGLSKETPRYRTEIPWRVRGEHVGQYAVRMLRLLGRRRAGHDLSGEESSRLDAWLEQLGERGFVVAYCPEGAGFLYVEADEIDDRTDVPIRPRTIGLDEIEE